MKPVKLEMQAFGPYSDREVVDFAELGSNRVFLIHGDTGAGKTTILDAVVFALYGDTSGGERQPDQMRCDHAAADLRTEVVFDFRLGERSFRIRRRPGQQVLGARGGSMVSKQAEVAFWERTGCAESDEGKPLATKIRQAEAEIRSLLGFSCEQFRQVVVLPQGRFRELLSAGSDKREEILRQLFRTERYKELETALEERARLVSRQMEKLRSQREAQLETVGANDDAELIALIEIAGAELRSAADVAENVERAARQAADALAAAEAAEESRRAVAEAQAELDELEKQGEKIANMRRRLEMATRAEAVRSPAERLSLAQSRLAEARAAVEAAEQQLQEARSTEQAAVEALAAENGRLAERQALVEKKHRLEGLVSAMEAWRSAKLDCDRAAQGVALARAAYDEAKDAEKEARGTLAAAEVHLAQGKEAAVQLEVARSRLEEAKRNEARCRLLHDAQAKVAAAELDHTRLGSLEVLALRGYQKAEAELAEMEERWRSGRAVALAVTLQPGEPCPVCGSLDHPTPAVPTAGDVSDQDLGEGRSAAGKTRQAYEEARAESTAAREQLAAARAREESLKQEVGLEGLSPVDAANEVAQWEGDLAELASGADVGALEERVRGARAAAAAAAEAAEAAAADLMSEEKVLAGFEARLSERVAAIPQDLLAEGALEAALTECCLRLEEMESAFLAVQERASATKETRIALEAAVVGARETVGKAIEDEHACGESCVAALAEQGFSDLEGWRDCLMPEERRVGLQDELGVHRDALHQARGRLQQAKQALEGRPEGGDMGKLQAVSERARLEHTTAVSRHADARSSVARLERVRERLAEIDQEAENVRHDYASVGVLAEVAGGQNPGRVSFQRWVLGVYLDEVLTVAGRRLYAMSKGRYHLERQRETASRRRPSGLDLAVFDEFSGTSRPAVTLSGGESFLAALALALGLAETVQEHSAGTPLETIFVDEGFGALDADALELAMDALMELQLSGRLVGVISHVPELKQVIPARLEVRGGPSGSSTRFFVP